MHKLLSAREDELSCRREPARADKLFRNEHAFPRKLVIPRLVFRYRGITFFLCAREQTTIIRIFEHSVN